MTTIEVRPDRPANGGAAVGRVDGRVVFVDGAIPGELVRAQVTDERQQSFWKAEVVEILEPSPHRIDPACPAARHGAGCCDLGFVDLAHARTLKAQVLSDALTRIGGLDAADVPVAPLGDGAGADGTRWRVRTRLGVDGSGRVGMRHRHGSAIVAGFDCAAPESGMLDRLDDLGPTPGADLAVVADADGRRHVTELAPPRRGSGRGSRARAQSARRRRDAPRAERVLDGDAVAVHRVGERTWRIPVTGFWQAHRAAPATYSRAVVDLLAAAEPTAGGLVAWDLYGGAGVFAAALLDDPAASVAAVHVVESDAAALAAAAETFDGDDRVTLHRGEVAAAVRDLPTPDVVVLDPPRTGAGATVIEAIADADPPTIIHVGCDVGRFARDLALFAEHGYHPREIRGFDAFPATHHVEAIAALVPVRRL
ncbi:TRAM domain-containing protein [Gordonia sp. CPCC 205515]|uniref:class I SAM-dependent RNA methyltransferase n=1 Tax=Gordonia sp. CPCC 205515 TaxID=3140791 RepID=UPI003AF3E50D